MVLESAIVKDQQLVGRKRAAIVEAAVQLFSEKGYSNTRTKEIAEAAGLTVGGMYQYVRSKQDVLYLVCEHVISATISSLNRADEPAVDPIRRLAVAIHTYIHVCDTFRRFIRLIYRDSYELGEEALRQVKDMDRSSVALFEQIIGEGADQGVFKGDDPWLVARDIVNAGDMWALKTWAYRERTDVTSYTSWVISHTLVSLGMTPQSARRLSHRSWMGR